MKLVDAAQSRFLAEDNKRHTHTHYRAPQPANHAESVGAVASQLPGGFSLQQHVEKKLRRVMLALGLAPVPLVRRRRGHYPYYYIAPKKYIA